MPSEQCIRLQSVGVVMPSTSELSRFLNFVCGTSAKKSDTAANVGLKEESLDDLDAQ